MTATQNSRGQQARTRTGGALWLLYVCDAALLVASGLIHLHLWDIAYRHVKTMDMLFLIQVAACLLAAAALLVTRHILVVIGSALLMAGTVAGFLLARTVGLLGFHLPFSSGLAYTVLVIEVAAVLLLGVTAWLMPSQADRPHELHQPHELDQPHKLHRPHGLDRPRKRRGSTGAGGLHGSVSWENAGCGGDGSPDKRSLNRRSPSRIPPITVSLGE